MKGIKDASTIIGLLEDGQMVSDFSKKLDETIKTLCERAGYSGTAKGSVTLTLNLVVEGQMIDIDAALSAKVPLESRRKSVFFVSDEGLATENPKQLNIEDAIMRQSRA